MLFPVGPGQDWYEAFQDYQNDSDGTIEITLRTRQRWQAVCARLVTEFPTLHVSPGKVSVTVRDDDTGLYIALHSESAMIEVPYWYAGEQAQEITATAFRCARLVEQVTGWKAFDPQLGALVGEMVDASAAAAAMSTTTEQMQRLYGPGVAR